MELLRIVETRIGRWLAYADYCVNTEEQLARCQPFWTFVVVVFGILCLVAVGAVIIKMISERRKRPALRGNSGYRRAS